MVNADYMLPFLAQTASTSTPIDRVPFVLLFDNCWPVRKYSGPQEVNSINTFIQNYQADLKVQGPNEIPKLEEIPQQTQHRDLLCYLPFSEAYKNGTMKRTA
jgi:thioredoxin-like negative regulator of GroEL